MTQPIFRQIVDDEGNPTGEYEQVNDVFKEVVVHDKRYQKATNDAYEGRQTIKALNEQLALTESDSEAQGSEQEQGNEAGAEEIQATPEPAPAPINRDELYEEFRKRMKAEAQAKAARQEMVARIGRENNVNPALLRGNTEEELTEHAQQIAKDQLKFRDIGASPDGQVTIDEGMWDRIDKRFGWEDKK